MAATATIVIELDDRGVLTGFQQIGTETRRVEGAFQKVGQRGNVVMTELSHQQQRARDATSLLARTLGVEVPRQLERVVAQSRLVGPALATAFNVSVALAFGAAIVALLARLGGALGLFDSFRRQAELTRIATEGIVSAIGNLPETVDLDRQINSATQVIIILEERLKKTREALTNVAAIASDPRLLDFEAARRSLPTLLETERKLKALLDTIHKTRQGLQDLRAQRDPMGELKRQLGELDPDLEKFLTNILDLSKKTKEELPEASILAESVIAQLGLSAKEYAGIVAGVAERNASAWQQILRDTQTAQDVLFGVGSQGFDLLMQGAVVKKAEEDWQKFTEMMGTATEEAADRVTVDFDRIALEHQRMVDQMAFELERWFDDFRNIGDFFSRLWKRIVAQMVAQWILGLDTMRGASAGGLGGGGIFGGILGRIFGGGGGVGAQGGGGIFGGILGRIFGGGGGVDTLLKRILGGQRTGSSSLAQAVSNLPITTHPGIRSIALTPIPPGGVPAGGGGVSAFPGAQFLLPGILGALAIGQFFSARKERQLLARQQAEDARRQVKEIARSFEDRETDMAGALRQATDALNQFLAAETLQFLPLQERIRRFRELQAEVERIRALGRARKIRAELLQGLPLPEFHTGGFVSPMLAGTAAQTAKFSAMYGGYAKAFHDGGEVFGRLRPGEFVLCPEAVRTIGVPALERMNRGQRAGPAAGVTIEAGAIVIQGAGRNAKEIADEVIRRINRARLDKGRRAIA